MFIVFQFKLAMLASEEATTTRTTHPTDNTEPTTNNKDEITDKCINNLNQNLNNIKKSMAQQQAHQLQRGDEDKNEDWDNEEYENFNQLTSQMAPVRMSSHQIDPRLQKQLDLLNNMNNNHHNKSYEITTQHELFINPIANDITQFALDSCKLEQKIAAKFNRPAPQLNIGRHSGFQSIRL